jgi:hypothetical protein
MLKDISRAKWAGLWVAAIVVLAAGSVVGGVPLTIDNSQLWLVACLAPPAVMLLVWRGGPPLSAEKLVYSVNRSPKDTRP